MSSCACIAIKKMRRCMCQFENGSQSEVVQTLWVSLTFSDLETLEEATLTINALKTQ